MPQKKVVRTAGRPEKSVTLVDGEGSEGAGCGGERSCSLAAPPAAFVTSIGSQPASLLVELLHEERSEGSGAVAAACPPTGHGDGAGAEASPPTSFSSNATTRRVRVALGSSMMSVRSWRASSADPATRRTTHTTRQPR